MSENSDYDEFIADSSLELPSQPVKPENTAKTQKPESIAADSKKKDAKSGIKKSSKTAKEESNELADKLAIFHDPRKLTKAGKAALDAQWSGNNRSNARNGLMKAFTAVAKEKFGATKVFGSRKELDQLCVGIPTPSLPIEYVLANDVLPFALIMLAGSWGSCKSSLLFEFFRWVYELNGLPFHIDAEHKFDADFACRIMRSPHDVVPFVSNRCNSTEEWQEMFTHYVAEVKRVLTGTKQEPGPGPTIPVAIGLDSLAAGLSQELQDKVVQEGHADRAHPIDALKNKNYLNAIIPQLTNFPFMILVVNHLKTKKDDRGIEHSYTLGGENVNFRESIGLNLSVWRSKFKNSQFEGIGVKIACSKNSFGPTHRWIKTRFLWWHEQDPTTGQFIQQVTWDWDWSICSLLHEAEGIAKNRLKAMGLDIKVKSPAADVECLANMVALGMGKEEYLPWQEVGQMIHSNPEICSKIREALDIKARPKLINGLSLADIHNDYRAEAE